MNGYNGVLHSWGRVSCPGSSSTAKSYGMMACTVARISAGIRAAESATSPRHVVGKLHQEVTLQTIEKVVDCVGTKQHASHFEDWDDRVQVIYFDSKGHLCPATGETLAMKKGAGHGPDGRRSPSLTAKPTMSAFIENSGREFRRSRIVRRTSPPVRNRSAPRVLIIRLLLTGGVPGRVIKSLRPTWPGIERARSADAIMAASSKNC